jgi:hypothetical protein
MLGLGLEKLLLPPREHHEGRVLRDVHVEVGLTPASYWLGLTPRLILVR